MIKLLNKYKVLFIFILLVVSGLVYNISFKNQEVMEIIEEDYTEYEVLEEQEQVEILDKEPINLNYKIPIFICGQVKEPGVYQIDSDSLIEEVLIKAGGFTQEADRDAINLAKVVTAHEQIYIPKVGEKIDKVSDSYDNIIRENESGRTNINTADHLELERLPGIGEVKARQIIAYREENGLFKNLDELKNVSGIGNKTYEALLEHITIE